MRPSIIFGPDDSFFNRFAAMARLSPALPLIGGGAHALPAGLRRRCRAAHRRARWTARPSAGTIYELGGPEIRSFKELMQSMLGIIGRKRLLVPIPFPVAKLQAAILANPADAAA